MSTAPIGPAIRTVHRYVSEATIDPGAAGGTAVQVYSLNGLYDPDISGVGHQPMGFDQLNGLYNDYVVYGCHVELEMLSTDTTYSVVLGYSVYPGATTTSDYQTYLENPNSEWGLVNIASGADSNAFRIKKYFDIASVYGRTKQDLITEDYFKGNGAANPTDQVYLHIFGAGYSAQNPGPVATVVRLTYYVHWFNPKLASKS